MSDLITPQQLADRWGMTTGALAQQRFRGDGPVFVRVSARAVRYRLADVEAYELAQRYSRTDTKATA